MILKFHPALNHDGTNAPWLISAVIQDYQSNEVLFVATMDRGSCERTQSTGFVHIYSYTYKMTRRKGLVSGNYLEVVSKFINCNHDNLLIKVRRLGKDGGVCHTIGPDGKNRSSCFFQQL